MSILALFFTLFFTLFIALFISPVFLAFVRRSLGRSTRSLRCVPGISWWAKSRLCRGLRLRRIGCRLWPGRLLNLGDMALLIRAGILRTGTLWLGFPAYVFTLPVVLPTRFLRRIICTVWHVTTWRGCGLLWLTRCCGLLPLGWANLWCLAPLLRTGIIRTATFLFIFPTYAFTWLVAVIFGANRMLLFGGTWVVIAPIVTLICWQRRSGRDGAPIPFVPSATLRFPVATPVLPPAWRGIGAPATEVMRGLAVVADRYAQHVQGNVLRGDEFPRPVVPIT